MMDQSPPRVFHTDLEGAYSEVAITLDDPPTFTFVRSPFNFTRPLPHAELRELAVGRFGPDLDAQLRACTLPPTPPLSDGDRACIVRLAGDAWAAAETTAQAGGAGVPGGAQPASLPDALPPATPPPGSGATTSMASAPHCAAGAPAPRRELKVLLTLRPDGPAGYHALVGVGAAGCDPHFATVEPSGTLPAVLNAVPAIVAAAETHWRTTPHYPTALRPTVPATAAPAKEVARPRAGVTKATGVGGVGIDATTTDRSPAKSAATTQISLFG